MRVAELGGSPHPTVLVVCVVSTKVGHVGREAGSGLLLEIYLIEVPAGQEYMYVYRAGGTCMCTGQGVHVCVQGKGYMYVYRAGGTCMCTGQGYMYVYRAGVHVCVLCVQGKGYMYVYRAGGTCMCTGQGYMYVYRAGGTCMCTGQGVHVCVQGKGYMYVYRQMPYLHVHQCAHAHVPVILSIVSIFFTHK